MTSRAHGPEADVQPRRTARSGTVSKRTNRILGDYTLSKTLGAGSMGKVKLATHNITGEKLAVKILPRARVSSQSSASKEASKEIRILREAALSLLLHHPYICGMREMIVHQHHYYMVFEYVNGGQLLDYIISHGRLRERVARKFARQIASALDYCHRNNVVHRDLKIENILISQSGNIKIIDFGLSNLYDPVAHLTTFCGSLYFAAPELLNAKAYTGPEIDIWSFGVVLYTLVCGKVPFEDESMPALHAKIKRGLVEYPIWLSPECKHILSRMLVINPVRRAPLSEIIAHPWMVRGFSSPPTSHLPVRLPLRVADIDRDIVLRMSGLDFGIDDKEVYERLVAVLDSDAYVRALAAYDRPSTPPTSTPPVTPTQTESPKKRRFSGFDFYRRIFPTTPPPSPSPTAVTHGLQPVAETRDPARAFHPLLSMYYLAREKMERDRLYGMSTFASSQISVVEAQKKENEEHNTSGDLNAEDAATEKEVKEVVEESKNRAPNGSIADEAVRRIKDEAPDTTFPAGKTTAPRLSSNDAEGAKKAHVSLSPNLTQNGHLDKAINGAPLATEESTGTPSLPTLRIPQQVHRSEAGAVVPTDPLPPMGHRRSRSLVVPSAAGFLEGKSEQSPPPLPMGPRRRRPSSSSHPAVPSQLPRTEREATEKQTTAVDKTEELRDGEHGVNHEEGKEESEDAPVSGYGGETRVRRFGSLVVGSARSDNGSKGYRSSKRIDDDDLPARENATEHVVIDEKAVTEDKEVAKEEDVRPASPAAPPSPAEAPLAPQRAGSVRRRATAIVDPAARAAQRERRSSTGAAILGYLQTGGGTIGRHRRPSLGYGTLTLPRADRVFPKGDTEGAVEEQPEEEERQTTQTAQEMGYRDGDQRSHNERQSSGKDKPVFLRGLLSVATTSTKPPTVIEADIRRVLDRMQVQYWQGKGGFECIHLPPSEAPPAPVPTAVPQQAFPQSEEIPIPSPPPNTGLAKRLSRLSFSVRRVKSKDLPQNRLSMLAALPATQLEETPAYATPPRPSDATLRSRKMSLMSLKSKVLSHPSHDRVASPTTLSPSPELPPTGAVDRDMLESMGNNASSVRFEINIVKVPLLPLHGIQFRRSGGDGWQYQMLARRVLTELKL